MKWRKSRIALVGLLGGPLELSACLQPLSFDSLCGGNQREELLARSDGRCGRGLDRLVEGRMHVLEEGLDPRWVELGGPPSDVA